MNEPENGAFVVAVGGRSDGEVWFRDDSTPIDYWPDGPSRWRDGVGAMWWQWKSVVQTAERDGGRLQRLDPICEAERYLRFT